MDTMAAYGLYNGGGVPAAMYSDAAMTNLFSMATMTTSPFMGAMPPTTVRLVEILLLYLVYAGRPALRC